MRHLQQQHDGIHLAFSTNDRGMHFEFGSDGLSVTISVIFEALRSFFNMLIDMWNNILRAVSGEPGQRV